MEGLWVYEYSIEALLEVPISVGEAQSEVIDVEHKCVYVQHLNIPKVGWCLPPPDEILII